MFMPSLSSTIIISCCSLLMIIFFKSSCAYVIDTNSLMGQQSGLNLPSSDDRFIRSTKFPRIGRSLTDSEEINFLIDTNTNSEENDDENDIKLIEQRSVLFPRIGKRAFHNILWANNRANPHRMLDAQGRYSTNGYGYDYHVNQVPHHIVSQYRGKRDIPM